MAASLFGDALDLDAVRIVRGKWWPFQPRDVIMAPTGSIHFHPDNPLWAKDFSTAPLGHQGLVMHELTHVLQAQQRGRFYLPLMRHPFCRYGYKPEVDRPFGRYGLEQQAEIVRHAFLLRHGPRRDDLPLLAELETILPFGTGPSAQLAQQL
ncbi:vgr related protein [Sphingomonas ginkgonis]|uniref:Vgr related protein n=1 Tax=Sphingomonas ginkgonis TaxID=2315330 RepID=A0A3S0EPI4_9SPHN|nr:vgr related protein [Sphingomonas ginkgonis]RST32144.1 vgr related protein [Sphingomonas ginkgonis]